eukprot:17512-Heterococcus_DN1.PRE.1
MQSIEKAKQQPNFAHDAGLRNSSSSSKGSSVDSSAAACIATTIAAIVVAAVYSKQTRQQWFDTNSSSSVAAVQHSTPAQVAEVVAVSTRIHAQWAVCITSTLILICTSEQHAVQLTVCVAIAA